MEEVPDSIERELVLPVPPTRVWAAITQAEQLGAWWGTEATIDLRPGGEVLFTWRDAQGKAVTHRGVIETLEPPTRFAFRWQFDPGQVQMTLVEFTLQAHPEGTHLRLVESGFASVPPELRASLRERNTRGWQSAIDNLGRYLVA